MNKKAIAQITISSIIMAIFMFFIWDMVFEEVEPIIEDTLIQLDDSVICPPEFSSSGYEVCMGAKGEIVVNGIFNEDLDLSLDSSEEICIIKKGYYENKQVCMLKDIRDAKNVYLTGISISKITSGKKLLS